MKISDAIAFIDAVATQNLEKIANGNRDAEIIVPYLVSDPGCGKTSGVRQVAARRKAREITLSLAQYDPSELGGWKIPNAEATEMRTVRPQWMPDGETETFLFLDELPQATVACQNIAAQIVNERRVGPHHLPDNCIVVAAGNPTTARAGTNQVPTHLRDRMTYLNILPDVEDTVAYFNKVGVSPVMVAYLRHRPDMLSVFDPNADACPSPRSWERVASIINLPLPEHIRNESLIGQIGKGASNDFLGYLKLFQEIPDIDALIADPDKAPIPESPDILYAISAVLAHRMTADNATNILKYLARLNRREFAALVVLDAITRDINLKTVEALRKWVVANEMFILDHDVE